MKEIIRKVIQEAKLSKFKQRLKDMGPKKAKESFSLELEDFVDIVHDGDIVDYVLNNINELTELKEYGNRLFMYDGDGPFRGTVFRYVPRQKTERLYIENSYALVPQSKLDYLSSEGLITKELLIEFLNEFYDLYITRIVPERETNFG